MLARERPVEGTELGAHEHVARRGERKPGLRVIHGVERQHLRVQRDRHAPEPEQIRAYVCAGHRAVGGVHALIDAVQRYPLTGERADRDRATVVPEGDAVEVRNRRTVAKLPPRADEQRPQMRAVEHLVELGVAGADQEGGAVLGGVVHRWHRVGRR